MQVQYNMNKDLLIQCKNFNFLILQNMLIPRVLNKNHFIGQFKIKISNMNMRKLMLYKVL